MKPRAWVFRREYKLIGNGLSTPQIRPILVLSCGKALWERPRELKHIGTGSYASVSFGETSLRTVLEFKLERFTKAEGLLGKQIEA